MAQIPDITRLNLRRLVMTPPLMSADVDPADDYTDAGGKRMRPVNTPPGRLFPPEHPPVKQPSAQRVEFREIPRL
jgi:hypothetical protein